MEYNFLQDFCSEREIEIRFNEPMSLHTSLRIGGMANVAVFPQEEDLPALIRLLKSNGIYYVVIGGGTNLLILDGGIEEVVVFTKRMSNIIGIEDGNLIVQGGCNLQRVVSMCADFGLSGMEGLAGIPGSIGGAIAGNSGSFGYEIKDTIDFIDVLYPDSAIRRLRKSEIRFSYRSSNLPDDSVILNASFALKLDEPARVIKVTKEYLNEKRLKQPLNQFSAGCVFKNPEGLSAGKLIDEAGCKGLMIGGIQVSRLHANYFINVDNGTAEDFLRLMDLVSNEVKEKFNIILEPEIRIIGKS